MKWQSFDDGFTSVAQTGNSDSVVLKVMDYTSTDETRTGVQEVYKTLNNRNYSRGRYDRDPNSLEDLPPDGDDQLSLSFDAGGSFLRRSVWNTAGIFPVGRRENLIRGSDLQTAMPGSPGTLPGDMFVAGCSYVVDGVGVQNGINYVDVTLSMTAGQVSNIYLFANGANTLFKSSCSPDPSGLNTNLALDFTWYLGLRPGSVNINPTITQRFGEHTNGSFATGNFTSQVSRSISIPADGIIRPYSMTGTVPQSAATKPCVLAGLLFGKALSSAAASIPLRIGWPVLDSTGWYHNYRKDLCQIVPLTAKTDTVFTAHRTMRLKTPIAPQYFIPRRRCAVVLDIIPGNLHNTDTVKSTLMPLLRLYEQTGNTNIITLFLSVDQTTFTYIPLFYSAASSTYYQGDSSIAIAPGRRMKMAFSLDTRELRCAVNGSTLSRFSDSTDPKMTDYLINDIQVDGTGYLLKRLDVFFTNFSDEELINLSR